MPFVIYYHLFIFFNFFGRIGVTTDWFNPPSPLCFSNSLTRTNSWVNTPWCLRIRWETTMVGLWQVHYQMKNEILKKMKSWSDADKIDNLWVEFRQDGSIRCSYFFSSGVCVDRRRSKRSRKSRSCHRSYGNIWWLDLRYQITLKTSGNHLKAECSIMNLKKIIISHRGRDLYWFVIMNVILHSWLQTSSLS